MTDIVMGNVVPLKARIKELERQVEILKGVINRMYVEDEKEWYYDDEYERNPDKYVILGG